jgi:hypothetical protein
MSTVPGAYSLEPNSINNQTKDRYKKPNRTLTTTQAISESEERSEAKVF